MKLSDRSLLIEHSEIRDMFNRALKYDNVISFTLGEPDFTAPQNVVDAGCKALMEGKSKYSANAGIIELRKSVSDYLQREEGLYYNPDNEICITTGGMGALYLSMASIVNPGDEVIILEPYWTNYQQQVQLCGGIPKFVQCMEENQFMAKASDIESVINDRTRAIVLNSPCNPTGAVYTREALIDISKLAIKYDLIIIADEVYNTIVFDDEEFISIGQLPDMKERTIIVNSFSKSFAMTGWRVGYAAGPENLIDSVTKLQEDVNACAPMPAQYGALEALRNFDYNRYMVSCYKERRNYIAKAVNGIDKLSCNVPKGTFYLFVNISKTGLTSRQFAHRLLDEKHVVVVPGTAFGSNGDDFIRISYATSMDNIRKGVELIKEFVESLGN